MATATINDYITTGRILTRSRKYNGFTWDERIAVNKPQRILRAQRGSPQECAISGYRIRPGGSDFIYCHLEDYRNARDWLPVSKLTHRLLHARFTDPRSWFDFVYDHYQHGAWFTMLVMSPTKVMNWGFDRIYPMGLPKDGEFWGQYATSCGIERELFKSRDLRDPIRAFWSWPEPLAVRTPDVLINPPARRRVA